jgi:hypothetical protein
MTLPNQNVKTRVENVANLPQVQFYDPTTNEWGIDTTVTFSSAGTVSFILEAGNTAQSYIFFGATQKIIDGVTGSSDTNWDLTISGGGQNIMFTSNDSVVQTISIKLALIPQDSDDLANDIISADPRIKNVPPL